MKMRTRFASLRIRLTLWYVLLLALILAGFSGFIYLFLDQRLDQQQDDQLKTISEQALGAVVREHGQLIAPSDGLESEISSLGEQGFLVRVLSLDGTVSANVGPLAKLVIPARFETNIINTRQPQYIEVETGSPETPVRLYGVPLAKDGVIYGFVIVGQSLKPIQDTLHLLFLILALGLPVTLIFTSASGLFLANRALAPIDRITRTVQRISAEDLTKRLNLNLPQPEDEVGRLANTFDAMLQRLEEAFNRQRQFTDDASHELRTPLAIIKGNIGVALNRSRPAAEYQTVLVEVEEEVDRLTKLVDDLLLLARADSGYPILRTERLDLGDILAVVMEQVRPLAKAKNIELNLEQTSSKKLELDGDLSKLLRLFLNLLDNAIKYTPVAGEVKICVETFTISSREWVKVSVEDNGAGIAPEQLARIFERFYRTDEARTRSEGGSGLGLTLARWSALAHSGRIEATSVLGQGSVFAVWLPKYQI